MKLADNKSIVIFSTAYFPFVGGAEVAVKEITDRIEDFDFHLITARLDRKLAKQEKIGNVHVHRVGFGIGFLDKIILGFFGHKKALELHKKYDFKMLWSIMASYGGLAGARFKKKSGLPYLLTLQEGDKFSRPESKGRLTFGWFKKIFVLADGLQAISSYLLSWGKKMGFKGSVAKVIPNGVEFEKFFEKINADEVEQTRECFGFPKESFVLITTSRLVEKNGIKDVIRALPKLQEHVCFVVVGGGILLHELERMADELGVSHRVSFKGEVPYNDLPRFLQASDLFIRPSLTEGLGNSFLEAMAAGLLIVGTKVGGIPEFLSDDMTGFYCEPNNPDSIVHVIEKVIGLSNEKKSSVIQNAQELVKKSFHWKKIVIEMKKVFNTLCEF